ncbi:MAG: hypothetical protein COS42_03815 [Flavobacteriales bacterium CG03_land_8_20_14_0_80_35_15]|nr:hypothetical protein [Zetaproteobacteria bacterium]OIO10961.1 MAG: hypothetical protein AUJ53_05855 [Flavobacteriaceae bacterium CG1_02_35_72]PIV17625.1 MAG: hypothetical protein COS42_03815 [Flavobacteriales bacterium CG03_land_8_20_14_0_80_35_15]PIX06414.1 MAG: hypothetical protein COZ76_09020 [Flavobacteriales bacterium CG_4_8_14_3_um_filter_35_10]PJA05225.1 MAG: hypothetical protein COX71_07670 [Flavobacteriales bacterium CG_4_10_14_0_2_um_filter_35_18]
MQKITSQSALKLAILQLEQRQEEEGRILKEQFKLTYNSLKPANILLGAIKDLSSSTLLKDNILNSSVSLGAGYASKMLFQGIVSSPIKKILGSALMFGVTKLVSNNPDFIKTLEMGFLKIFGTKSKFKS